MLGDMLDVACMLLNWSIHRWVAGGPDILVGLWLDVSSGLERLFAPQVPPPIPPHTLSACPRHFLHSLARLRGAGAMGRQRTHATHPDTGAFFTL